MGKVALINKIVNLKSLLLLLILSLATLSRLWRINDFMTFLGDEGRDVIIVRRMLTELHPALIGPQTSVGNMYLGPLYYYLMSPFLLAFNFSPVGPAVMVAIFGVATVALVFKFTNQLFGNTVAFISALLYATSPLVISSSRSSWNPNILPFFSLLSFYALWQIWTKKRHRFFPVLAISFAFVIQSHYLGLLILPPLLLFGFLSVRSEKSDRNREIKTQLLAAILIFSFLMSPLLIFDLRHNFINSKSIKAFFTARQETVNLKAYKAIPKIWPISQELINSLITTNLPLVSKVLPLLLLATLAISIKREFSRRQSIFIATWLISGLVGLGLYKQTIYHHYYGFIFPLPFIVTSLGIKEFFNIKLTQGMGVLLVIFLLYQNLFHSPLRPTPNLQLSRTEAVTRFIANIADNRPFNLALISKRNYDAGYRYFFMLSKSPVLKVEDKITDQLFVICEDPVCNPINHPSAEIANFGWAEIKNEWRFPWGTKLFRLTHPQKYP